MQNHTHNENWGTTNDSQQADPNIIQTRTERVPTQEPKTKTPCMCVFISFLRSRIERKVVDSYINATQKRRYWIQNEKKTS
mmetsp:Transcript_661/g.715  ORF Transcript_661/g.715 Transcript_661/m.715 type:complete len:81 (-) Transcript_661:9-251(-)